MAWALAQRGLDPSTKFVLIVLADHANDDGVCWPGQKGIAAKVGTTDRQVRRHIAKLIESGLVKAEKLYRPDGGFSVNEYTLQLPQMSLPEDMGVLRGEDVDVLSTINHKKEPPTIHRHPTVNGYSAEFEQFWSAYPKKVGKGDAFKAWQKNGHPPIQEIIVILALACQCGDWLKEGGQYIPNPATWLNGKRWDDDYTAKAKKQQNWY